MYGRLMFNDSFDHSYEFRAQLIIGIDNTL